MKKQIIDFLLNHLWHIFSMFTYSVIEYKIGKSNIKENSLIEILMDKFKGV